MSAINVAEIATEPKPEPPRDRWGRYLIPGPNNKPVAHTRATTVAKTMADTYALEQWQMRQVAAGLARRQDLIGLAAAHDPDTDRKVFEEIVEGALEASGSAEGRRAGTTLHRFTELVDLGQRQVDDIPEPYRARVTDYRTALTDAGVQVHPEWVEQIFVADAYTIAGTADRIVTLADGRRVIADLKGLDVNTPIPTPAGWTTMLAIKVGDTIYDRHGNPTKVTAKSEIHHKQCYRITFDDTTSIVADHDHRWWVKPARRPTEQVMTTTEMAAQLRDHSTGQRHLQIINTAPLATATVDLPIDPYVLGAWIGDGHKRDGVISKPLPELWAEIQRRGHEVSPEQDPTAGTRTVYGLRTKLREAGLLGSKAIPSEYLRASEPQRRDLLAGLMDTDGSFNTARRECVFYTTSKALAAQAEELIVSLGYRALVSEAPRTGFGKTVTCYDVKFRPHDQTPFIAKADRWVGVVKDSTHSRRRLVMSVEEVPSVPTQCIAVDSPDSSYLCGHQMVPTHNTGKSVDFGQLEFAIQLAIYANHDATFNQATGRRGKRIDVDRETGLIIHLPAQGTGCALYTIDLVKGYDALITAMEVREWRKVKPLAPYKVLAAGTGGASALRDWLRDRIRVAAGHSDAALADLGARWPTTVPQPLPVELAQYQIEDLATALDRVEAAHQIPLGATRPGTVPPTKTAKRVTK